MNDDEFLSLIGHTKQDLDETKIEISDLRAIYDEHQERRADLEDAGDAVQKALTRIPGVHSTRVRVKSPVSLARKVVRKKKSKPERNICFDTYKDEVRDLIGLRALHLFKEDWEPIHRAILGRWNLHPEEKPLAYLREGDSEKLKKALEEAGFDVESKPGGYRSLHFIVQTPFDKTPCYSEIQVRTLFEEAWGEVDHQVRYPDHEDDEILGEYLLILNRLAGGADEMASLLLKLKSTFDVLQIANAQMMEERAAQDAEIQKVRAERDQYIEKLAIGDEQKVVLKEQFESTSERRTNIPVISEINERAVRLAAQLIAQGSYSGAAESIARLATQNSTFYTRVIEETAQMAAQSASLQARAAQAAARVALQPSLAALPPSGEKPKRSTSKKDSD